LVHLPIGGLLLLGMLELMAKLPQFSTATESRRLILGLITAASVLAASFGWILSIAGDYDGPILRWHRWTGTSLTAACGVTWWASRQIRLRAYACALSITLLLLVVVGHLGASLTHGPDFLTRYAPGPFRSLFGNQPATLKGEAPVSSRAGTNMFADLVQPILQQRCIGCHGPEKHKAGLRLDNAAALLKGGKSGPAFVAGKPAESLIVQRLTLPLEDDDHMPPASKRQPTPDEISLIRRWIEAGATVDGNGSKL
jgi:mono/diheme cytochrome c family protein